MKYSPRRYCLPLLFMVSIAGAEEEAPEITLDPSGYSSSQPEFVVAPDFVPDLVPDLVPSTPEYRPQYPLNRIIAIVNITVKYVATYRQCTGSPTSQSDRFTGFCQFQYQRIVNHMRFKSTQWHI